MFSGMLAPGMKRSVEVHQRLYREWPELSQRYRDALGEITSPEVWESTFAASVGEK